MQIVKVSQIGRVRVNAHANFFGVSGFAVFSSFGALFHSLMESLTHALSAKAEASQVCEYCYWEHG